MSWSCHLFFFKAANVPKINPRGIDKIIDKKLTYKVYGNFPFEMDYGENAFTLANYLNQHLEKPVIRKQTYRSEN